jgi:hypothetical protein
MNISRTDPSIVAKLLLSLSNQKTKTTANSNSIIKPITLTTLAQELMHIGYNKQGNEMVANTSTNQTTVIESNVQDQNSTTPVNEDTIDGKATKYTGSLTADQIAEKYVNGDNVNDIEYCFMVKGIGGNRSDAALISRCKTLEERNISQILVNNNIQLDPNQELKITVDLQNKVTVSGINDTEKLQQIEDALNSKYNMLAGLYQISSDTYKSVSKLYYAAAAGLDPVEQYLNQQTEGTISLTDLSIQDDKIVGLTPALDSLLNKDTTSYNMNNPEDKAAYEAKIKIVNLLAHMKVYGTENLPHANYTLSYKNETLSYIEQPDLVAKHPETLSNAEYYDKAELLQDDPIAYYNWFTESATKGTS